MTNLLPFFLLVSTVALAADVPFYLGTYTKPGKSEGIYFGRLDTETGRLGPVVLAGKAVNPSYVALSPDGRHLYSTTEENGGAVAAFAVSADGRLTLLNTSATGGTGTCHVWVDAAGRNVLSADYSSGTVASMPVKADGSLGERTGFAKLEGSGPDPKRQARAYAHGIYSGLADKYAYVCDLGSDKVWTFRFDAARGALTPAAPPFASVPPGGGPRHLALHPSGNFAYVNNEMGLTVTAFARDAATGALTALETVPTLPAGTDTVGVTTAEIFCHPTGKWLYVSNRGHDSIATYSIAADGRLHFLEAAPAQVKVPRGFAIDPNGRWLITAGQDDHKIAVLKIDSATGRLTPTGHTAEVGSPVCVLFARP